MMPSGYDFEPVVNAEPAPPPPPRFTRDQLDATGQKIFDQLKQQREAIEKQVGVDEAKKYYSDLTGLTKDETTALMAMELQSTGITDIYKVRKDESTERMPVRWGEVEAAGEGAAREGYYYIDPVKGLVEVGRNEGQQGYIDIPRVSYVNTDTGQVINPNAGGPFSGREGFLSDYSVGKRRDIGTGVLFSDEGIPLYFSQGEATPSSWKSFTNSFREMAASPFGKIALGVLLGPAGAGLSTVAAAAAAGGLSGLAAEGDLKDALKGAALGAAGSYALGQLTGGSPSALDAGMGTYDVSGFNPVYDAIGVAGLGDPTAGFGGMPDMPSGLDAGMGVYDPSGFNPVYDVGPPGPAAPPNYVDDLFSGAGAPTPDVAYPELYAPPTLPDFSYDDMVPPSALPGYEPPMDPSLGDPTAGYGGMPKDALDAGMDAYPTVPPQLGGPPAFDPASALETQFDLPNAGAGIGIPAALAALGADAKAFLGTTAGRLLASTLLTAAASKAGGGGGGGAGPQGWSGDIPKFQAVRERVPLSDAGRRPGEYGRRYFSDTAYVPLQPGEENLGANIENVAAAQGLAQLQAQELAKPPVRAAAGGLMGLAKGRYLNGTTDGMEDQIPANIDGQQPARLSHGEFVIPADVVSHLGNGNSQAGAKRLYEMMDKIRHARTGTKKQGKQINADKYLPV
jgi:hypothetical protein